MKSFKIRISAFVGMTVLAVGIPLQSWAAALNISDAPLFVSISLGPNVMFTTDDSGSMQFDYMPSNPITRQIDGWNNEPEPAYLWPQLPSATYGSSKYDGRTIPTFDNDPVNAYHRSSSFNTIYYDPTVDYEPWTNADGSLMADADPGAAYWNPADTSVGSFDLKTEKTDVSAEWSYTGTDTIDGFEIDVDCKGGAGDNECGSTTEDFWPMVYWVYKGAEGGEFDTANYDKIEIRNGTVYINDKASTAAAMNQITGMDRTIAEEEQNFANWFQYYRSRALASRAGIGKAFQSLGASTRVGFGRINKGSTTVDTVATDTIVQGVREFDPAGRDGFYKLLYEEPVTTSGTPLRTAAKSVGEYFKRADAQGPWSTTPGADGGQDLACRQSYHILLSDGYWSGGTDNNPNVGNSDGSAGSTITSPSGESFTYSATSPFSDSYSNTLADVGMEYWKTDLRGDMDNRVPTNEIDIAFWQHLTAFGVGFGVDTDAVDPDAAFAAISDGSTITWPDPTDGGQNDPGKIDDLLHFAVNGRGGFFSAANPVQFAAELAGILSEVVSRANATTSVAISATRLSTSALIYAASFDSADWSGELLALNAEDGTLEFRATDQLDELGEDNRNISTYDPATDSGIAFEATSAVTSAIGPRMMANVPDGTVWTAAHLIEYVRGNDSPDPANPDAYRARNEMLGDIANSRPVMSASGNEGWGRVSADYLDYIDGHKNDPRDCDEVEGTCNYSRKDTLFIGANDGMLHAFDARTLEEFFAYVPATVHGKLHHLADPDYSHKFFVDGQVAVSDAKIGGSWGTYLVGTLGAGGRGVYALDITDPENFDESDVLWEFTFEDDPDLGFTFGEPIISRLEDGTWVAVFGNGYNSESDQAYLYVVDLENGPGANGEVLHKVALGSAGSNGLSGVAGWRDAASRTHLSRVYAGDLNGTMWRVDFTDSAPATTYASGLFTDATNRPITATPNIAAHTNGGLMIFFGTGKLIESDDRIETNMDRFYGVRDAGSTVAPGDLSEVVISEATPDPDLPPMRVLSSDTPSESGWFMNLAVGNTSEGERTLAKPRVIFGTVITSTYQPVEDPCTPGGIQRTYVLDALSGKGALPFCSNCGGVEVGTGAPFSPPVAVKQRDPGPVGDVTFPGNEDPTDPTDPGEFPDAPDAGDGDRQGWCSEFGIPPLFEGGSFLPLGTICEGRQVWRQIK